jgi:single-strand DNA-binding protein
MNKVILMGRLTKDPDLRYTNTNSVPVCTFTLAVNRRFSRQGEERQADFINVIAWSKNAEFCKNYFKKGQQVAIVGRLQTRSWDDEAGKRHFATEVIAEETYFADSRKGSYETNQANAEPAAPDINDEGFISVDDDDNLPF